MKAIVQTRYGPPDVLQLKDVDKPVVKDDEVLVRVHAVAVNIGDGHLLRGMPYVVRLVAGLRKPRREIPGLDITGRVEPVGGDVKQFRPGDEVFGWCKGAFAEYACAGRTTFCRVRPTSRWSNRRRLRTPRSPLWLPFAIKERCSRDTRC
jgi:NADPH:quinone reductase-like Zn-dependent oxidoreductase